MKVRKAKKRFEPMPETIRKRNDLNNTQLMLLSRVRSVSEEEVSFLSSQLSSKKHRNGFYDPLEVSQELGVSRSSIEHYIHCYLRVVRREGEMAKEFSIRKRKSNYDESPLERTPSGFFRWASPKIILFCILAPTRVAGNNDRLREIRNNLKEMLEVELGKKSKIKSFEQTHSWETNR